MQNKKAFIFRHEWGDIYIAFSDSEEDAWILIDKYNSLAKPQRHRWVLVKSIEVEGIHKVYEKPDEKFY